MLERKLDLGCCLGYLSYMDAIKIKKWFLGFDFRVVLKFWAALLLERVFSLKYSILANFRFSEVLKD